MAETILTCAACGSRELATPNKGRRTGQWFVTCRACFSTMRFLERPELSAPVPVKGQTAPEELHVTLGTFTRFDPKVAESLRPK
jgi:hypothetical protein